MSTIFIYPHDEKSNGARAIKEVLGGRRILHRNSTFQGSPDKKVINWGSGNLPEEVKKCHVINSEAAVNRCSDKIHFFQAMAKKGGRIPEWTTSKDVVTGWLREGKTVVARTLTRAKSGAGIVFFENLQNFVAAPLYTVYKPKKEEFRIHFAFGEQIDEQKKVLRKTDDAGQEINPKSVDWRVRNLANGFIFARSNISIPPDVIEQARKCYAASGLDFGAVDVIYNEKENKAYVLEINTAPGLEGTTIENYTAAFRRHLG